MALWPRDERIKRPVLAKRRERRGFNKEQSRSYPNLEPGLIGAVTLLEDDNNRLKWDFLTVPSKKVEGPSAARLKFGKHINVFPPTRPTPVQSTSRSIQQRAEQGANFLRTYLPDIEIASELIRDQLVAETTLREDLELFDPYSGNLLEVFLPPNAPDMGFLIFATGETSSDLSVSSINYSHSSKIHFKPSATPLHTFSTPIQQIVTSKSKIDANFIVRTYSSTQIFDLKQNFITSATGTISPLANFSREDMNDEVVVDVKCLSSPGSMLVVGDDGTVFSCTLQNGAKSTTPLHINASPHSTNNNFWRLSLGSDPSVGFVMSDKKIQQFDLRMNLASHFYSTPNGEHKLTSIEDCVHENILSLCSTNQIIWMDTRFTSKPLLAYSHGRQYDRYLSTETINQSSNHPLTFLTSRSNGMVTVYDISRSVDELVHLNVLPYVIPGNADMYQKHIGQQFIFRNGSLGLARLSEERNLEYGELSSSITVMDQDYAVERPKDMSKLVAKHADLSADVGPLGLQEFTRVDLHLTYDALFRRYFAESKITEEENGELIYQLLDYFPSYLQNKDLPADHILTTYDIVFGAGDEPDHSSRADYLSDSIIHSKRGYRALKQGRLSAQLIKSPWHRSILPSLQRLDPDFPSDSAQAVDYLAKFNLPESKRLSNKSREYEQDACQLLAMDLALSSDIYSDITIFKTSEVDKTLESMTEALSIGDGPPPVQFGYLKPLEKDPLYVQDELKTSDGPETPLGVRLLLKDWDAVNPDDYIYQDPYNSATLEKSRIPRESEMRGHRQNQPIKHQRPPQVLASNIVAPPEVLRKTALKIQSQDRFLPYPAPEIGIVKSSINFSQDLAASTQVLPGPHGGRPGTKKKPAKKRLGGF